MITFYKNTFKGQSRLWKAFWLLWLLQIGWGIFFTILAIGLAIALGLLGGTIGAIVIVGGTFFLSIHWLVACWRCAFNVNIKAFAYITRVIVVLATLATLSSLVTMFGTISMMLAGGMMMDAAMQMPPGMHAPAPGAPGQFDPMMNDPMAPVTPMDMPNATSQPFNDIEQIPAPDPAAPVDNKDGIFEVACAEHFDTRLKATYADMAQYAADKAVYVEDCIEQLKQQHAAPPSPEAAP